MQHGGVPGFEVGALVIGHWEIPGDMETMGT